MKDASTPTKLPIWVKLLLWAGLACIGQFFVCALIGVIRGYSIQSYTPFRVMLGGSVLLLISDVGNTFVFSEEVPKLTWKQIPAYFGTLYLAIFCLGLGGLMGFAQGRYQAQGELFYKQKNYPAAIAMYRKEVDTWYLRLRYNYREDMSLFGIAQSYCQLEDFGQARKNYQRLFKMARGYYKERAQKELTLLDRELENIAALEKQWGNETDDNQKAKILFDKALSYRRIGCTKKAIEQYALVQTLNARESQKEQAKQFAADQSI